MERNSKFRSFTSTSNWQLGGRKASHVKRRVTPSIYASLFTLNKTGILLFECTLLLLYCRVI